MSYSVSDLVELMVKYEPRKLILDNDCFELEFDDIEPIPCNMFDRDDIIRAFCILYDMECEDV